MIFYTVDTVIDGEPVHLAVHHVVELLAWLPADHPAILPSNIHRENRRPTVAERQQLWSAEQRTDFESVTTIVAESFPNQAR